MEKNTPKYSSKVKQKLKDVPNDLFEKGKDDIDFKTEVIKTQYNKDPLSIFKLIKSMIK